MTLSDLLCYIAIQSGVYTAYDKYFTAQKNPNFMTTCVPKSQLSCTRHVPGGMTQYDRHIIHFMERKEIMRTPINIMEFLFLHVQCLLGKATYP